MLMRAANSKVSAALDEFRKKVNAEKEAEERAKKNTSPPLPAAFTDKEIGVKALKGEAKKCKLVARPRLFFSEVACEPRMRGQVSSRQGL